MMPVKEITLTRREGPAFCATSHMLRGRLKRPRPGWSRNTRRSPRLDTTRSMSWSCGTTARPTPAALTVVATDR